jgi:hypothetical protein
MSLCLSEKASVFPRILPYIGIPVAMRHRKHHARFLYGVSPHFPKLSSLQTDRAAAARVFVDGFPENTSPWEM